MSIKKFIFFTTISFYCFLAASAQDIEHLSKEKPFTFHGNIGLGTSFYTSDEPYLSRDPFAWNLYANFAPSFYGFDLPFTLLITQYSKSYSQPFSQIGISPRYKWVTLHLGYRNIEFSPLVFGGTSFLGGGIELSPKWFRFAAFYGRLNKAINQDTTADRRMQPQYARIGYGAKIGFASKGQEMDLQYFYAKDDNQSLKTIIDTLSRLQPQENAVFGTRWKFTFFKKLHFDGAMAASLLSQDNRYHSIDSVGTFVVPSILKKIMPITYSSFLSFSGQARLALNLKNFNWGAGYRRSQPDYKSLGTPYTLNDIEMMNTTVGTRLLKGKLSLNTAYSRQRNNLNGDRGSTLQSQNGNFNISSFINKHLMLNASVNLVNLYQKDGTMKLTDSIRMNQLMTAYSFSPNLNFQSPNLQHTISTSVSYTGLNDKNPVSKGYSDGTNLNSNLNYGIYIPKSFKGFNLGVNYSLYNQTASKFNAIGLNFGANAQFLKEHNLSLNGNFGYFFNHATNAPVNNNFTFSVGCNYSEKKHSFGFFATSIYTPPIDLDPMNKVNNVPYFVNTYSLSGGLNYSYSF